MAVSDPGSYSSAAGALRVCCTLFDSAFEGLIHQHEASGRLRQSLSEELDEDPGEVFSVHESSAVGRELDELHEVLAAEESVEQ
jgi:hypothetical protein